MGLASIHTVVLGTFAFLVFWVLAVFPSFKLLPIGRTAGAVTGAVLTVVFQVDSPTNATSSIDLSILSLLFGTMVVGIYLERADLFRHLGDVLSWKSKGGKDLLCRVCILSALTSALFTNDTCCLVLTEFVLKLCKKKKLPPEPFLIALASSSNIGSSVTPIGNPQNLVIAVQSAIPFGTFLIGLLPSALLGIFVNIILLLLVYWRQLSSIQDLQGGTLTDSLIGHGAKDRVTASPWTPFHSGSLENIREFLHELGPDGLNELAVDASNEAVYPKVDSEGKVSNDIQTSDLLEGAISESSFPLVSHSLVKVVVQQLRSPAKTNQSSFKPLSRGVSSFYLEEMTAVEKWRRKLWKCAVYFVTVAMLVALFYGLDLSWTALTAAATLMALDFSDAGPCLEKVSYPLLVFFAGMFITVEGFNVTGIPGVFWDYVEPVAHINDMKGIIMLTLVVLMLSNVVSNVPTVLLLGTRISLSAASSSASVTRAWLILAWTTTVAGNLTLVGSAANLIVSEQARKSKLLGYDLTFWSHLLFGFPSTVIVAAVGLPFIRG